MSKPIEGAFIHRRRISFGDTDGAGIVYTPRVTHFGLEAIEAWFFERLGLDGLELNLKQKMGTPFVRLEVDFVSPMAPPDWLDTEVLLEKAGRSSLSFRLTGRIDVRVCWRAAYVCAFVSTESYGSIPIPEAYRPAVNRELRLGG